MKRITARIAVLAAGIAVPAAIATAALADTGPGGGQAAAQLNATQQNAQCAAKSDQFAPSSSTSVSDGSTGTNNGNVTQDPQSEANCAAINANQTNQDISQKQQDPSQAQDPGNAQFALQANKTDQNANCKAESNQFAPSQNERVSKDSTGANNGDVTQAPSSQANCVAANINTTGQNISQRIGEQDQDNG